MPLSKKKGIHGNIAEMMKSWHKKRKIGNVKTKSVTKAKSIAAAIAYRKMGEPSKD